MTELHAILFDNRLSYRPFDGKEYYLGDKPMDTFADPDEAINAIVRHQLGLGKKSFKFGKKKVPAQRKSLIDAWHANLDETLSGREGEFYDVQRGIYLLRPVEENPSDYALLDQEASSIRVTIKVLRSVEARSLRDRRPIGIQQFIDVVDRLESFDEQERLKDNSSPFEKGDIEMIRGVGEYLNNLNETYCRMNPLVRF